MDLSQVIVVMTLAVSNIATVIYLHFRSEDSLKELRTFCEGSNKDLRSFCESSAKDSREFCERSSRETREILRGIADEMKDFHKRMCVLEERNKGKESKGGKNGPA